MTDQQMEELRRELEELKEQFPGLTEDLRVKAEVAEKAMRRFLNVKAKIENIEYKLAQHDGRLKQVSFGVSGKAKSKKKGGETFSLEQYVATLSPEAKEAFIRGLLNP